MTLGGDELGTAQGSAPPARLEETPDRGLPDRAGLALRRASSVVRDPPSCCTWVPGVGVWELLSGVLASASAVASSLWVMGRGPAAPE